MNREDLDQILEALETSISTIRSLHGIGMDKKQEILTWALFQRSPEMIRINTAKATVEYLIRTRLIANQKKD